LAAKGRQRGIDPDCFHVFRRGKRFHRGFYVFGFEEAVKVKRYRTEVQEYRHGGVSGPLGVPTAIRKEKVPSLRRSTHLRKVVS
jgi:hypothetical protein